MEEVKQKIDKERDDQSSQANKWVEKIRTLIVDATLDESLSEDLRERIIAALQDLSNRIYGHEAT